MNLRTADYSEQKQLWPASGRHIMAQFDDESIVVYQAYRPSIGRFAITHGHLGGDFSYSRMSWIKPNFLWMMFRSGWGEKEAQEITLGLRIRRAFFESILAQAVSSTYREAEYSTHEEWQRALVHSPVRVQWDPDHDPRGNTLDRRAIQLGLRGPALHALGKQELLEVIDLSAFVAEQRAHARRADFADLRTPVERPYVPSDAALCLRLGLLIAGTGPGALASGNE